MRRAVCPRVSNLGLPRCRREKKRSWICWNLGNYHIIVFLLQFIGLRLRGCVLNCRCASSYASTASFHPSGGDGPSKIVAGEQGPERASSLVDVDESVDEDPVVAPGASAEHASSKAGSPASEHSPSPSVGTPTLRHVLSGALPGLREALATCLEECEDSRDVHALRAGLALVPDGATDGDAYDLFEQRHDSHA